MTACAFFNYHAILFYVGHYIFNGVLAHTDHTCPDALTRIEVLDMHWTGVGHTDRYYDYESDTLSFHWTHFKPFEQCAPDEIIDLSSQYRWLDRFHAVFFLENLL